jgi:hypothetical protein
MILFPFAWQHIAMLPLWENKNQSRLMKAIPATYLSDLLCSSASYRSFLAMLLKVLFRLSSRLFTKARGLSSLIPIGVIRLAYLTISSWTHLTVSRGDRDECIIKYSPTKLSMHYQYF